MQNTLTPEANTLEAELMEAIRAVMSEFKRLPSHYDIYVSVTPDELYCKLTPKHNRKIRRWSS